MTLPHSGGIGASNWSIPFHGSRILDPQDWIQNSGSKVLDPEFWIHQELDPAGSRILDPRDTNISEFETWRRPFGGLFQLVWTKIFHGCVSVEKHFVDVVLMARHFHTALTYGAWTSKFHQHSEESFPYTYFANCRVTSENMANNLVPVDLLLKISKLSTSTKFNIDTSMFHKWKARALYSF